MLKFSKIFGSNPFKLLMAHMQIVSSSMEKLQEAIHCTLEGNYHAIGPIVAELSKIEFNADSLKLEIRNSIAKAFFPIIRKEDVLELVILQDMIANKALEAGNILSYRHLEVSETLKPLFIDYNRKCLDVFEDTKKVVLELTDILEVSFGGPEFDKVRHMVEITAHKEYESDLLRQRMMKELYALSAHDQNFTLFYQTNKFIETLGQIAHVCEGLALKILLTLDKN
jgi:predicted phosphate transport protein (TIGR00153 family)